MQDLKDLFKDLYGEDYINNIEKELDIDARKIDEQINPPTTKDSEEYSKSNKYIFKEFIEYEKAEKVVEVVTSVYGYDEYNLNEYKDNIYRVVLKIFEERENPIEMLIYSTIGLRDNIHKNAVLDTIKDLISNYREKIIKSYSNILLNWSFNECLDLVLKSIQQNMIKELDNVVYEVFEKNDVLRESAGSTLINLGAEKKFKSIINFLVATTKESTELLRSIMFKMGKNSDKGSQYMYRAYLEIPAPNRILNCLTIGIRLNMTNDIYDDIYKKLSNVECKKYHNILINLLQKTAENKYSQQILNKCLENKKLDRNKILVAIGNNKDKNSIDKLVEVIKSDTVSKRDKINAVITLGSIKTSDDEKIKEILKSFQNKSEALKIACSSALIDRGENKEILTLFRYLGTNNIEPDEYVDDATNQIKRLIISRNEEANTFIFKLVCKVLNDNKNSNILKIVDLYSNIRSDEEISKVFLEKCKQTQSEEVKSKILIFFKNNYSNFTYDLKEEVLDEIRECSKISKLRKQAMDILKDINLSSGNAPEFA